MKDFITVLAIFLVAAVITMFALDVSAEPLDMTFDSTVITSNGASVPACLVQNGGVSMVIPDQCGAVAAEVKKEICNNIGVANTGCDASPLTIFNFTIDGEHWGQM